MSIRIPNKVAIGQNITAAQYNAVVDALAQLQPVDSRTVKCNSTTKGTSYNALIKGIAGSGTVDVIPPMYELWGATEVNPETEETEFALYVGRGVRHIVGNDFTNDLVESGKDFWKRFVLDPDDFEYTNNTYYVFFRFKYAGTDEDTEDGGIWDTNDKYDTIFITYDPYNEEVIEDVDHKLILLGMFNFTVDNDNNITGFGPFVQCNFNYVEVFDRSVCPDLGV